MRGIEVRVVSERTSVTTLTGEHDLSTKYALIQALARAGQRPNMIVDLTPCRFVDSSIMHVLLATLRSQQHVHGRLELVVPAANPLVSRIVMLMSAGEPVALHETIDEALRSVETPEA